MNEELDYHLDQASQALVEARSLELEIRGLEEREQSYVRELRRQSQRPPLTTARLRDEGRYRASKTLRYQHRAADCRDAWTRAQVHAALATALQLSQRDDR